jgi:hypothetical protein
VHGDYERAATLIEEGMLVAEHLRDFDVTFPISTTLPKM